MKNVPKHDLDNVSALIKVFETIETYSIPIIQDEMLADEVNYVLNQVSMLKTLLTRTLNKRLES